MAWIGSAVGDALGTPFEFGAAGVFSAGFLELGGGWEPGEVPNDTQMAV